MDAVHVSVFILLKKTIKTNLDHTCKLKPSILNINSIIFAEVIKVSTED